jgi:hypothetical protein
MLDYNSRPPFHDRITALIDRGLRAEHAVTPKRTYLGASRLGHQCERALQFEYMHTPPDPGREFSGRVLRIFEVGHTFEALAIRWLELAGFTLYTRRSNGEPFGFAVAQGRLQGHIDGVLAAGPADAGLAYPALWECKSMKNSIWRDVVKRGVALAKPVYAAQLALYQAYLADTIPGIAQNAALFTAINKDTQELWFERVPFDAALAQRMSDRGVRVLSATEAGELLPRIASTPTHHECRMCAWQDRCWRSR